MKDARMSKRKPTTAMHEALKAAGADTDVLVLRQIARDHIEKYKGNALKSLSAFRADVGTDDTLFAASIRMVQNDQQLLDEHWRRIFGHLYQDFAPRKPEGGQDQVETHTVRASLPAADDTDREAIDTHEGNVPVTAHSRGSPMRREANKAMKQQISRSIFETFQIRSRDGELRTLGSIARGDLRTLEVTSALEYFLTMSMREYIDRFFPNASMIKKVAELIPVKDMQRLIAEAHQKVNGHANPN